MRRCAPLLAATFLLGAGELHAAPLNTWGVFIGKGVFAVTPYVYAGPAFGVQPWVYGEYGFNDHFEVAGAIAATVGPTRSFDAVEVMPRFFLDDQTGIAVRTTWNTTEGNAIVAPELHIVRTFGSFELTLNPTWAPIVSADSVQAGSIGGIAAPEWFFSESCSVFVEVTPLFDLSRGAGAALDRFSLEVVPGTGFTIAEDHEFSVGIGVPLTRFDPREIYFGMWYSYGIGGEEESGEAQASSPPAFPKRPGA